MENVASEDINWDFLKCFKNCKKLLLVNDALAKHARYFQGKIIN